jgi:site-specific recombinase XerD
VVDQPHFSAWFVLVVSFWAFYPACGTPHSLRHWYGTNLVATGADLRTAQTLLRHANLQTTAIYVQVADEKRVEAIDRLDPFG